MFIKRAIKVLLIVIVAFVFASVGNALAAANSVPANAAGDGAETISGYTITIVHYTLATDPSNIASVEFHIVPTTLGVAPASVYVKIGAVVSSVCTWVTPSTDATCAFTGTLPTVKLATQLTVIAAQ